VPRKSKFVLLRSRRARTALSINDPGNSAFRGTLRREWIVDEETREVVLQGFDLFIAKIMWRAADHAAECGGSAETDLELRIVEHFADAEEEVFGFFGIHEEQIAEVQYLNVDEDA
jgi:hypothetical protein